jgi:hypothetical protein
MIPTTYTGMKAMLANAAKASTYRCRHDWMPLVTSAGAAGIMATLNGLDAYRRCRRCDAVGIVRNRHGEVKVLNGDRAAVMRERAEQYR